MIDHAALPQAGISERFSEVVRRIRYNSGLRQVDVAERAGMTCSQWAKVENYRRKDISVRLLCRVAGALSLSGTQLLGILEAPPSELSSSGN